MDSLLPERLLALVPGSLLYVLYALMVLHAKLRNLHSPPAPCYMYYMCYIILHARKSVLYVLYRAI